MSFGMGGHHSVLRTLAQCVLFSPLDSSSPTWDTNPPRIQVDRPMDEHELYDAFACLSSRLPPLVSAPAALTFPMEMSMTGPIIFLRALLSGRWNPFTSRVPPRYMVLESYPNWEIDSANSVPIFLAGLARLFSSSVCVMYVLGGISRPQDTFSLSRHTPVGDPEQYRASLRPFRCVTELHLGPAAGGLPELMHGGNSSSDGILFPALCTIHLHASKVSGYPASHDAFLYERDTEIQHTEEAWWTVFIDMLAGRVAQGYGIHRLVLRGRLCHVVVTEGEQEQERTQLQVIDIEDLKGLVEDVVDERDSCGPPLV